MKRLSFLLAALSATALVNPANASVAIGSNYTFNFKGDCTDCQGVGVGTLTLQNYVLNSAISKSNFVSFSYAGTNLLDPFTLTDISYISGSIGDSTASYNVRFGGDHYFSTYSDGSWSTGRGSYPPEDFGTNGVWSVNSGVPEPATWAMFIGGFGLIGATMRRKGKVNITFAGM